MSNRRWVCILALAFVLCVIGAVCMLTRYTPASRAEVRSGGELVRVVDLSVDQKFTVETASGYNTITVSDGKIAVTEASCPDQYCAMRGFCDGGGDIICLPNGLVIHFLDDHQKIDAFLG